MNRFSKLFVILGALLFWYAMFGFLIAPALIQHFGEKQLKEQFSPESAVSKVRINPFTGSFRVEGMSLKEKGGAWSVFWQEAELNISSATLVKFHPVVDVIRLEGADIRFEKRPNEGVVEIDSETTEVSGNWRDAVDALNLAEVPELRVDLLEVSNCRAEFTDLTAAETYSKTIDPINFTLNDFTTVVEGDSQMRFVAKTEEGATLTWEGDFRSQPIRSSGRLTLDGLEIHDLSPYYTKFIRFDLKRALLGFDVSYTFDLSNMEELFVLSSGRVQLSELNCVPSDGSDRLINVESVVVDGIDFKFPEMALRVAEVSISDGQTLVAREADGRINLTQLVVMPEQPEVVEPEAVSNDAPDPNALPPLSYVVDKLSINNYRVSWREALSSGSANLDVLIKKMSVSGYSSDTAKPFEIEADYQIGESGRMNLAGSVTTEGPLVDLAIHLEDLSLGLLSPYGEEFGRTKIKGGKFNFNGNYYYEGDSFQSLSGDLVLADVHLSRDGRLEASWKQLALNGLMLEVAPLSLKIDAIDLLAPELVYTSVRSDESAPADTAEESGQAAVSSSGPDVKIGKIQIEEGDLRFIDGSLEPSPEVILGALSLQLSGLDLAGRAPAEIGLQAELNGSSLQLDGVLNINSLREETRIQAKLSSLALPQFSSYSGRAVGRRIANGRLDLESDWTIQSSQLKASNKILIEQLKFGDSVKSEGAVSLPLDLAVTLLQGPNGVMDLSLPLSGDLSDPKVSIGQIVRTAIFGLVTNVASAPFKMLSGLVGTEQDLSTVNFEPGDSTLPPNMLKRLNALSTALKERPALKLVITPQVSEADRKQLSEVQLRLDLMGADDPRDEKLFRKRLTERYRETMKAAGTPDEETRAEEASGLQKMVAALVPGVELPETELSALAAARAAAIREHLVAAQGIAPERLAVAELKVNAETAGARFDLL